MRLLDAAGISYRVQEYEVDENDLSGIHVAKPDWRGSGQCFQNPGAEGREARLSGMLYSGWRKNWT